MLLVGVDDADEVAVEDAVVVAPVTVELGAVDVPVYVKSWAFAAPPDANTNPSAQSAAPAMNIFFRMELLFFYDFDSRPLTILFSGAVHTMGNDAAAIGYYDGIAKNITAPVVRGPSLIF